MAEEIKMLLDYHGFDETLTIATEECAELIKEITKYKRAKNHSEQIRRRSTLLEEIADVSICIDMMLEMFDLTKEDIVIKKKEKMERNILRIL